MGMGGEIFENLQTGGPLQLPSQEYGVSFDVTDT